MKQFCVYLGLNVLATMIFFYRLFHGLTNVHSMQEAGIVNIRKYGLFLLGCGAEIKIQLLDAHSTLEDTIMTTQLQQNWKLELRR